MNIDLTVINFGKRIQQARILRNITQEQLAEKCGVTPKHISAIERGTSLGSISLLLAICNFLHITPDSLFVDSISKNTNLTDNTIIPIEKHETLIKYSKLSKNNQKFVDATILHLFNEQTKKIN